jgi:hypothetical protein
MTQNRKIILYIFVVECSFFLPPNTDPSLDLVRLKGMRINIRLDLDPSKRNRDPKPLPENSELDANVPYPGRIGRLHIL